jgi:hypothetical protein
MMEDGNPEGAGKNLNRANIVLESIRVSLIEDREQAAAGQTNSTNPETAKISNKLYVVAEKYEKKVIRLLNATQSDAEMQASLKEALSVIADARINIALEDFESARTSLNGAYAIIIEAEKTI